MTQIPNGDDTGGGTGRPAGLQTKASSFQHTRQGGLFLGLPVRLMAAGQRHATARLQVRLHMQLATAKARNGPQAIPNSPLPGEHPRPQNWQGGYLGRRAAPERRGGGGTKTGVCFLEQKACAY